MNHTLSGWRDFSPESQRVRILLAREQFMETWTFRSLAAPHWRLYHVRTPGSWVRPAAGRQVLEPGFVYLIPPETEFSSGLSKPITQFYVHFLAEQAWIGPTDRAFAVRLEGALAGLLAEALATAGDTNSRARSCQLHALVLSTLAALPDEHFEKPHEPRLRRVIALLVENLRRTPENGEIAAAIGLHPRSLPRWFASRTGVTPQEFLRRRRIQEACVRLASSDATIEEIADALGFTDRYHFTKTFTRYRRISPGAFRRRLRDLPAPRRENDFVDA